MKKNLLFEIEAYKVKHDIVSQGRGELTQRIKDKSKELLGYEITVRQLRLIPYIADCLLNNRGINPQNINGEEREILINWKKEGLLEANLSKIEISKESWHKLTEILYLGYIDLN